MDTQQVWDVLLSLPIGTVVAWIFVICAILAGVGTAAIKLYKVFSKYRDLKERNEEAQDTLTEHGESIKEIKDILTKMQASLDEQREVNLKQLRHDIVHTCDDAIAAGYISIGKLKSLEEMFEEYVELFHGNGYVKTLVMKVRQLPIVGKLDD